VALRSSRATAVALVTLATFTDILAYSIAVPVLPDLSRRFGASPTMIGLLFASFGVTVLATSIPMARHRIGSAGAGRWRVAPSCSPHPPSSSRWPEAFRCCSLRGSRRAQPMP